MKKWLTKFIAAFVILFFVGSSCFTLFYYLFAV